MGICPYRSNESVLDDDEDLSLNELSSILFDESVSLAPEINSISDFTQIMKESENEMESSLPSSNSRKGSMASRKRSKESENSMMDPVEVLRSLGSRTRTGNIEDSFPPSSCVISCNSQRSIENSSDSGNETSSVTYDLKSQIHRGLNGMFDLLSNIPNNEDGCKRGRPEAKKDLSNTAIKTQVMKQYLKRLDNKTGKKQRSDAKHASIVRLAKKLPD